MGRTAGQQNIASVVVSTSHLWTSMAASCSMIPLLNPFICMDTMLPAQVTSPYPTMDIQVQRLHSLTICSYYRLIKGTERIYLFILVSVSLLPSMYIEIPPFRYIASQLHFHWGSMAIQKGSEHCIGGKRFPAEVSDILQNFSSLAQPVICII